MASKLKGTAYLFAEENKSTKEFTLPFADIITYAYLKEELNLTPDSLAAQSLKTEEKYAPIRAFVKTFDEVLNNKWFHAGYVEPTMKELNMIGEKYTAKPSIKSVHGSLMVSQNTTDTEENIKVLRKTIIVATVASILFIYNIAK